MVDLHSHILPGLDDGAASTDASVEMALGAAAEGTRAMVATPHVSLNYDFDLATIGPRTGELNAALAARGIALAVLPGAEIALTRLPELRDDALEGLCLGAGRYVLVESPYGRGETLIEEALFGLQVRGYKPVLAHPERCPLFQANIDRLHRLTERGVVCSITSGSLAGRFGSTVRRFTLRLFREGLVHNVASDAHDAVRRPPALLDGFEAAARELPGIEEQADWYTRIAPEAIIAGESLPAQPRPPPSGSRWRWLPDRVRPLGARRATGGLKR